MRYFSNAVRELKELSFLIGESLDGRLICADMDTTPHLMVSGVTGSGKSVFLHSLLLALLLRNQPENLRFILCDSKIVELARYNGIPHLLLPVITDPKKISGALYWAENETDRRLSQFAKLEKHSLQEYNTYLMENHLNEETLPRIIIVIDDMSAILAQATEISKHIIQIILNGRIVGLHLLLVAQNPVQEEMRELTKLIPSKVAFLTLTKRDSEFLIASSAAYRLKIPGNAIFSASSGSKLNINTIMAEEEISESILSISKKRNPIYDEKIINSVGRQPLVNQGISAPSEFPDELDDLFSEAVDAIFEIGQASVSAIQKRLKLGYARATRLLDQMEEQGIVGPFTGPAPRRILLPRNQWENFKHRNS